jgi:hypothetical protein
MEKLKGYNFDNNLVITTNDEVHKDTYTVPKAFQVLIIYYKVSRHFLVYRELFQHILGSTATIFNIL